jgi:hypothetical protein
MDLSAGVVVVDEVRTGSLTHFNFSIGTATECSPMPRKPPTPLAIRVNSGADVGAIRGGRLRESCAAQKRGPEQRRSQIVRFHF